MAELTLLLRRAKRNKETNLDLNGQQICFIPNDIYSLVKLEILNLSNNKITTLDSKISELKNLKVIDLSDNSLIELPREILQLSFLQALNLNGNPLTAQFQCLLHHDSSVDIKTLLRKCFGLEPNTCKENSLELDRSKSDSNTNKAFGKMIEIENQLKQEQKKVKQLEKELEKLQLRNNKNSSSFSADNHAILQINFNQLEIFDQISMGGFSTIHRGRYKGIEVAVKKVFDPKVNEELLQQHSNEINMLAKYRHPNIVLLIGICSVPPNLAIVTEFVKSGSLYELLHKRKVCLKADERKSIVKQILSAVNYLHQHSIVHRDIKSHNILVYENYIVKLCDFGLARPKDRLQQGPMQFSGTPVYMAQQLFQKKSYDEKVDIFALGTLLFQIYTSEIPYNKMDSSDIKDKLLKDSNLTNHNIEKAVLQRINKCRNADPAKRPTAEQLYKDDIW